MNVCRNRVVPFTFQSVPRLCADSLKNESFQCPGWSEQWCTSGIFTCIKYQVPSLLLLQMYIWSSPCSYRVMCPMPVIWWVHLPKTSKMSCSMKVSLLLWLTVRIYAYTVFYVKDRSCLGRALWSVRTHAAACRAPPCSARLLPLDATGDSYSKCELWKPAFL